MEQRPRSRHHRSTPSFSSSLLDSIYRSIDESDGIVTARGEPDPSPRSTAGADNTPPPAHRHNSSRSAPARPMPIRTDRILTRSERIRPDPDPVPETKPKKARPASIKKKLQELKRATSPKLAGFLASLFAPASTPRKPKPAPSPPAPPPCLSKAPSTRGSNGERRSVRFCASVVGERERERRMETVVREMMMGFEGGEESDGSEDLFELENLGRVCGGFGDELPLYETTTNWGTNRAAHRGILV